MPDEQAQQASIEESAGAAASDAAPDASSPATSLRATAEAAFDEVMNDASAGDGATSRPQTPAGDAAAAPDDLFGQFGLATAELPEAVRGPLGERLSQIAAWRDDVQQWAEQQSHTIQQQAAAIQQYEQRLLAIAGNPRFQAALAAVSGGNGAAAAQPPQFETEAERILWERSQAIEQQLSQQHQATQQALAQIGARFQAADQQATEAAVANHVAELRAIHQTLDAQFPELASNRQTRQAWHAKAGQLLAAYEAAGEPVDLARAMQEAAQLLHYPHARNHGAASAMTQARAAARRSTMSEQGGRSEASAAGPRPGESLREFAERMEAEGAASGA